MSEPMRIRAQAQPNGAIVRVLMSHEMETGLRRDAAGQLVPAWHITEVVAQWNGNTVLSAQWGTAIAKNPFTQFTVKGAKSGDKISVSWVDSRGDRRTDEVVIA
jgi:sulfur-oxidizing protein SoxZ